MKGVLWEWGIIQFLFADLFVFIAGTKDKLQVLWVRLVGPPTECKLKGKLRKKEMKGGNRFKLRVIPLVEMEELSYWCKIEYQVEENH